MRRLLLRLRLRLRLLRSLSACYSLLLCIGYIHFFGATASA